jgi:hypothetical protein
MTGRLLFYIQDALFTGYEYKNGTFFSQQQGIEISKG